MNRKIGIVAALLAACAAGVWFFLNGAKPPAAAETVALPAADAAEAAKFVGEFRAKLAANDMAALKPLCDNPKSADLGASFELLRSVDLPERPERAERRAARADSWSLYYRTGGGELQVVLRRTGDGAFRFKNAYR